MFYRYLLCLAGYWLFPKRILKIFSPNRIRQQCSDLLFKTGRYQNTNGQNTNDHNTNLIGILIGSVGILIGSVGILIGSVGILIGSVGILNIFRTALFVVGIMKFRLVF